MEKKEVRKIVYAVRKQLSDEEVILKSQAVCARVTATEMFRKAERVLAYADYNHEVMTGPIIEAAIAAGKDVAVPKVVGKDMIFYRYTGADQLQKGYFGIPEPAYGEIVEWEDALMIMPGVAFDRRLDRVGYGGGFYDRFLEKHTGVKRLAIAFECQLFEEVPTEPLDIRPQLLVTEEMTYGEE